jgi:hypothetical protein
LQALGLLALRSHDGFGVGEGGEGLVALGRKQKSLQVASKAFSLGTSSEQVVETGSVSF